MACGAEHTVCLTEDGGVFSFGSGQYGQLGHGSKSDEQNPRQIIELMGTEVSQIACGKKHTLAFVPTRGRVYAFGLGGSGQLGNSAYGSSTTPQGIFLSADSFSSALLVFSSEGEGKGELFDKFFVAFIFQLKQGILALNQVVSLETSTWTQN